MLSHFANVNVNAPQTMVPHVAMGELELDDDDYDYND